MTSTRRTKNSCATCGKTAGTFICRGCSENFCLRHVNEHRQILDKQMNDIVATHNQIKQVVSEQTTEQYRHSIMQQVDEWEQQSIDKIHKVADNVRQQLLTIIRSRADTLKEKLTQLSHELDKAQHDGDFYENEIKEWSDRLEKYKRKLLDQQKLNLEHDRNSIPFISKISLSDMSFDNSSQSIDESLRGTNHNDNHRDYSESRSDDNINNGYSTGKKSFRYKIEQYQTGSSILFGIISRTDTDDVNPNESGTFYGWTGNDQVYIGGEPVINFNGYKTDIQPNDIFALVLDCDRKMISLTNERTRQTYDLNVNTQKCPFPWLPNVRFMTDRE